MEKFVIVIPSYKNERWYERNLQSAITQDYPNYRVIYTDDLSPDNTASLVNKFISDHGVEDKVTFIKNEERKGAMRNLYDMIHSCDDDEIVLTLDGDDWLAHPDVLSRLNAIYSDPNVWFTWGSYADFPNGTRGCSKPIPRHIIDSNSYRRQNWCTSHLRTFRSKLFKKIKEEDFHDPSGVFLDMAWDLAIYFNLIELGGHHGRYIHDILYIYNNENPISDHKVNVNRQMAMDRWIRTRPIKQRIDKL